MGRSAKLHELANEESLETTQRYMTWRYSIALLVIAVLVLLSYLAMQMVMGAYEQNSSLINVSGKQRMLSQRIALFSTQLVHADSATEREFLTSQLERSADEMEEAHKGLTQGSEKLGVSSVLSEELEAMYWKKPLAVDEMVKTYLEHTRLLIAQAADAGPENAAYLVLLKEAAPLLNALNTVVGQYEDEARNHIIMLKGVEHVVLIALFAALLLEAIIIFRPMVQHVVDATEEMNMAHKVKTEFLASMSHEIRTPMNGIIASAELMLGDDLKYRQQERTKTIIHSAETLLELINDILDYAKISSGRIVIEPQRFSLEMLARDVVQMLGPRAREKKLEVILRYMPNVPEYVVADPARIRQILFNLISNAIKFTPHGHVLITIDKTPPLDDAHGTNEWLKVSVADTGVGIPASKQIDIFDTFTRVDHSSASEESGTGLGLSICKSLVDMMEGQIGVQSIERQGANFWFAIPTLFDEGATPLGNVTARLPALRVLVVDDLEVNRHLLCEQLEQMGLECESCENGEGALRRLRMARKKGEPFQLGLFDYIMPEMDGEELARRVKQDKELRDLPLIILSSEGDNGHVHRFSEAGYAGILNKPAKKELLSDTISAVWNAHMLGNCTGLICVEGNIVARRDVSRPSLAVSGAEPILKGYTVLLVEDNRINAALAEEMVLELGASVIIAHDGLEAVQLFKQHAEGISLVLMDCQMPEMDGFEATRHLREACGAPGKTVPIIALTANAMKGDRETCLAAGMGDYLSKPLHRKQLVSTLKRWLLEDTTETMKVNLLERDNEASLLLDMPALQQARTTMRHRFSLMVDYFVEDTAIYIDAIEEGLRHAQMHEVAVAAHTIKSSAKALGAIKVSSLAKDIEFMSRDAASKEVSVAELRVLSGQLSKAYRETAESLLVCRDEKVQA